MTGGVCRGCSRWRNLYPTGLCARCTIAAVPVDEMEARLEQHRQHRAEVEESLRRHPSGRTKK